MNLREALAEYLLGPFPAPAGTTKALDQLRLYYYYNVTYVTTLGGKSRPFICNIRFYSVLDRLRMPLTYSCHCLLPARMALLSSTLIQGWSEALLTLPLGRYLL